jgi:YHS domain-containing protein
MLEYQGTDTPYTQQHEETTWYFCGTWCAEQFDRVPERFIAGV